MKFYISLFLFLLLLTSCRNSDGVKDQKAKPSDTLNASPNNVQHSNSDLRDSLYYLSEKKFDSTPQNDTLQQMKYEVKNTSDYLEGLEKKFILACGDSSGTAIPAKNEQTVIITERFFCVTIPGEAEFRSDPTPCYLFSYLMEAKTSMLRNIHNDSLLKAARQFAVPDGHHRIHSTEDWRNAYFKNLPPVIAITIINSFADKLKELELAILQDYLN